MFVSSLHSHSFIILTVLLFQFGFEDTLTTSHGKPVEFSEAISSLNYSSLLNHDYFMDSITHFTRERIPERVMHAKGAGAFGYFEVTHDITDICKAKLFSEVGKKTEVVVRFSSVAAERGGSDTARDSRGFAVKFYTEDGNFDLVGLNIPVFAFNDPVLISAFAHVQKKNPVTNLYDENQLWDFLTSYIETMLFSFYVFSNAGIPYSYRTMPGYSIHTYQLVNDRDDYSFARLTLIPDLGIKNLTSVEALRLGSVDADYHTRDLYRAIAKKEFPSWTLYMQVLTLNETKHAPFNVFDVTRILPTDLYPLKPVGRLVLNRNPENYFADVEQVAFCPGNLIPGILGAPDQLFQARRFAYRDAQFHRLGSNFDKIAVNCPFKTKVRTYIRDGDAPVGTNGGSGPNYYPNSFYGPVPREVASYSELIKIQHRKSDNRDQTVEFINNMSYDEVKAVADNIIHSLGTVYEFLQERAINIISEVSPKLARYVDEAIRANKTAQHNN